MREFAGGTNRFSTEFDAISHVGVPLPNTTVGPLYLWERARVRGFVGGTNRFLTRVHLGIPRRRTSPKHHGQSPLPRGEG